MFNRFLIAAPLAIAISAASFAIAAGPAGASTVNCTATPAQLRAAAANATPDQARKALPLVSVGEKICNEGGTFEAGKKFSAAAKALGTDLAALTPAPTAQ